MGIRLAIIADDLTGSLDTGVAFAARGWRTLVRIAGVGHKASDASEVANRPPPRLTRPANGDPAIDTGSDVLRLTPDACPPTPDACEALVWDTETRHAEEETARRIVREICEQPSVLAARRLYKKIDSTLRGPWLAELEEVWKARAPLTTLLCPAFPAVGRTVVDGELRVHGQSLAEAGFSGSGRLREIVSERWPGRLISVPAPLGEMDASGWKTDRRPTFSLAPTAPHAPRPDSTEPLLLLADAETDNDLDALAAYLHRLYQDDLFCGAGGLAAAWARVLIPELRPLPPLEPIDGPIWILAGSQHPATRAQMEALAGVPECHIEWLEAGSTDLHPRLRQLPGHPTIGLALTLSPPHPLTPSPITPSFRAWASECLGAAAAMARERGVAAFVATGGETAALLLCALDAGTLEIERELLPGIPLCRIADGPWAGTPLITKAGGFGPPDALARAVAAVRAGGVAADR